MSKSHSVLLVEIAVCMEYSRGPQARWKWQSGGVHQSGSPVCPTVVAVF